MRIILAPALAVALVFTAFAGADDKKADFDAKKIVGKWQPSPKDVPEGAKAVIEFTKDGKLNIEAEIDGKKESKSGTYKIEADKLTVTLEGDKAKTSTILKLTDETFEFKTESGKTTTFSRIKAK